MHFKLIFTLFFQNVNSMFVTEDAINFKLKYPKLADLLDHYAPGAAAEKYLQYGCNCNFLEDKPLASSGNGATLDPIDQACKNYKDCQRCVQMDDGADCNVENDDWAYDVRLENDFDAQCMNQVKSCRRHLCECDKQFADEIAGAFKFFDSNLQGANLDMDRCRQKPNFSTGNKFEGLGPDEIVEKEFSFKIEARSDIHETDAKCCGPTTGPRKLYHVKKKQCCMLERKTYHLAGIGECLE